jgi:hypothetical protein
MQRLPRTTTAQKGIARGSRERTVSSAVLNSTVALASRLGSPGRPALGRQGRPGRDNRQSVIRPVLGNVCGVNGLSRRSQWRGAAKQTAGASNDQQKLQTGLHENSLASITSSPRLPPAIGASQYPEPGTPGSCAARAPLAASALQSAPVVLLGPGPVTPHSTQSEPPRRPPSSIAPVSLSLLAFSVLANLDADTIEGTDARPKRRRELNACIAPHTPSSPSHIFLFEDPPSNPIPVSRLTPSDGQKGTICSTRSRTRQF